MLSSCSCDGIVSFIAFRSSYADSIKETSCARYHGMAGSNGFTTFRMLRLPTLQHAEYGSIAMSSAVYITVLRSQIPDAYRTQVYDSYRGSRP